jgi:hypothetical protein
MGIFKRVISIKKFNLFVIFLTSFLLASFVTSPISFASVTQPNSINATCVKKIVNGVAIHTIKVNFKYTNQNSRVNKSLAVGIMHNRSNRNDFLNSIIFNNNIPLSRNSNITQRTISFSNKLELGSYKAVLYLVTTTAGKKTYTSIASSRFNNTNVHQNIAIEPSHPQVTATIFTANYKKITLNSKNIIITSPNNSLGENRYTMILNSDGTYSFRSLKNNKFIRAGLTLNTPLFATGNSIGIREKFYYAAGSYKQGFISKANGKYITINSNNQLIANGNYINALNFIIWFQ